MTKAVRIAGTTICVLADRASRGSVCTMLAGFIAVAFAKIAWRKRNLSFERISSPIPITGQMSQSKSNDRCGPSFGWGFSLRKQGWRSGWHRLTASMDRVRNFRQASNDRPSDLPNFRKRRASPQARKSRQTADSIDSKPKATMTAARMTTARMTTARMTTANLDNALPLPLPLQTNRSKKIRLALKSYQKKSQK